MNEQKYQIAVVDDEPGIAELLKEVLESHLDCEVETFLDSTEALTRLQSKRFDVISFDHRMPKLSGMDLVRILSSTNGPNAKTRILLLTGYRDEAEYSNVELLDHVTILEKPITEDRYMIWINVLLKGPKKAAA